MSETFKARLHRVGDYLEVTDYGYGLGLLAALTGGVSWLATLWVAPVLLGILGAVLLVAAFALCWWFG